MSDAVIRVAYVSARNNSPTVMILVERYNAMRPGWSQSVTEEFIDVADLEEGVRIANQLKLEGKVHLVKRL